MNVLKVVGMNLRIPPMSFFMSKLCTAWLTEPTEEETSLEEGVGEEVEERGCPGPDTEGQHHVPELADGRIRQHLLDVVLDEGKQPPTTTVTAPMTAIRLTDEP